MLYLEINSSMKFMALKKKQDPDKKKTRCTEKEKLKKRSFSALDAGFIWSVAFWMGIEWKLCMQVGIVRINFIVEQIKWTSLKL